MCFFSNFFFTQKSIFFPIDFFFKKNYQLKPMSCLTIEDVVSQLAALRARVDALEENVDLPTEDEEEDDTTINPVPWAFPPPNLSHLDTSLKSSSIPQPSVPSSPLIPTVPPPSMIPNTSPAVIAPWEQPNGITSINGISSSEVKFESNQSSLSDQSKPSLRHPALFMDSSSQPTPPHHPQQSSRPPWNKDWVVGVTRRSPGFLPDARFRLDTHVNAFGTSPMLRTLAPALVPHSTITPQTTPTSFSTMQA